MMQPQPDLAPVRIGIPATMGTLATGTDFSINGTGDGARIGAFAISHGLGTLQLDGKTVPAVVYEKQPFGMVNLFQTLAVESDRLWVLWLYCSISDNSLSDIYFETTDGTSITRTGGSGTCQDMNAMVPVSPAFPALDLALPSLIAGYTISGARVMLDGAMPGSVQIGTSTLTVLAFNTVDCRSCAMPGWTELHSLLWDPVQAQLCFAIFYLEAADPTHVKLAYSLTLPSLTEPAGNLTLVANWTTP
jgi:hypothetical protein